MDWLCFTVENDKGSAQAIIMRSYIVEEVTVWFPVVLTLTKCYKIEDARSNDFQDVSYKVSAKMLLESNQGA